MAAKRNSIYLYLALACFLGIILIFVFDGYIGVYDSLSMTSGEFTQRIEPDQWPEDEKYRSYSSVNVQQGGRVAFTYEVDNRWFSTYTADVEVTVSHEQEQVAVLLSQPLAVASFNKEQLEWVLDAAELMPAHAPSEQGYEFTLYIKRGEIERRVVVHVRSSDYPIKVMPAPSR